MIDKMYSAKHAVGGRCLNPFDRVTVPAGSVCAADRQCCAHAALYRAKSAGRNRVNAAALAEITP